MYELVTPLAALGCTLSVGCSEAMTPLFILDVFMSDVLKSKSGIKKFGVLILHDRIILAVDKKDGRTVIWNVLLERQQLAHISFMLSVLAQQSATRTLVRDTVRH